LVVADEPDATLDAVNAEVARLRTRIWCERAAPSKGVEGEFSSNFMSEAASGSGLRRSLAALTDMRIDKPLTPEFMLFVKHPALFSALVRCAHGRVPVRAIVRHPLDVLCSWQTIDFPVGRGYAPMAERVTPELRARLASMPEVLARQCAILAWFFAQFRRYLSPQDVVRYEDLVLSPADILAGWVRQARGLDLRAEIRPIDPATRYRGVDRSRNHSALVAIGDAFLPWYPDMASSAGGQ
jgi:hypothetical protein